jgi:hypothetical protein
MSARLLAGVLLFLCSTFSARAVVEEWSPKDWKLPEEEAAKWIRRIKELAYGEDWSVTAKGNDIIVERKKPVSFTRIIFNLPPGADNRGPSRLGVYRLTLRFASLMSLDEYERRVAHNRAVDLEDGKLLRKYDLVRRFEVEARNPEGAAERLKAYRAEADKLVYNSLPDFYTPNYSITLFQSWADGFEYLDSGKLDDRMCNDVENNLTFYFGTYSHVVARGGGAAGQPEPGLR